MQRRDFPAPQNLCYPAGIDCETNSGERLRLHRTHCGFRAKRHLLRYVIPPSSDKGWLLHGSEALQRHQESWQQDAIPSQYGRSKSKCQQEKPHCLHEAPETALQPETVADPYRAARHWKEKGDSDRSNVPEAHLILTPASDALLR